MPRWKLRSLRKASCCMDAKVELVKNWLSIAQRDLDSAQRLAAVPDPLLDTAIYHCQQGAEKAVKGWLTFQDERFEKTHDVRALVSFAATLEPRFSDWFVAAEYLNPFALAYRYPGELLNPEQGEFDLAYKYAQGLYRFVLSLLPEEVYP
jgi:HEPN domain-containing protein